MSALVKQCHEQGINTFGVNARQEKQNAEKLLGEALKALQVQRQNLIITSKINIPNALLDDQSSAFETQVHQVLAEVEATLQNLQVEYIDLLFVEGNNPGAADVLKALQSKGLVIGVSNWTAGAAQADKTLAQQSLQILALNYSVFERQDLEENYRAFLNKNQTRIFASNPLASEMLLENSQLNPDSLSWPLRRLLDGKNQEDTFWKVKDLEKKAKTFNSTLS